jgi:hypothetical protein
MTVYITDYKSHQMSDHLTEISAQVGTSRLWFQLPSDWPQTVRGEPFLAAALLPAMASGQDVQVDASLPIDSDFLDGLKAIQQIFRHWGPALRHDFQVVDIAATLSPAPPGDGVGTFFSGGVDGTHTFLEMPDRPTHAVFVRGVDFQLDNPIYDEAFAQNKTWLASRGVPLIGMNSNIRWVLREFGIRWNIGFGAGLAAFAHVLGFSKTYVAAGHTWSELWPDGSHPATDKLWSSSTRKLVHHGRGQRRWQKLERIASEPGALEILRVCWMDHGYNCSKCEKCLRTMVLLRLLKLSAPHFAPLQDLSLVAKLIPSDQSEAQFVSEALELALDRGDVAVAGALRTSLRRYQMRNWLADADRAFFNGWLRRLRQRKVRSQQNAPEIL